MYIAAFSIGLGPVPWVIMSEVSFSRYKHFESFLFSKSQSGKRQTEGILEKYILILAFFLSMWQVFPIHVKGTAGSLVVLVNWLGAWMVSYTFNFLMSWSSPGKHNLQTKFN